MTSIYVKFVDLNLKRGAIDAEARTVRAVLTDGSVDRDQDRIRPAGVKVSGDFPGLYLHDHAEAVCRWVSPRLVGFKAFDPWSGRWEATAKFPELGLLPSADDVWSRIAAGVLKSVSIGFRPLEEPKENAHGGLDFTAVEVCEASWVPVPANRNAQILAAHVGGKVARGAAAEFLKLSPAVLHILPSAPAPPAPAVEERYKVDPAVVVGAMREIMPDLIRAEVRKAISRARGRLDDPPFGDPAARR